MAGTLIIGYQYVSPKCERDMCAELTPLFDREPKRYTWLLRKLQTWMSQDIRTLRAWESGVLWDDHIDLFAPSNMRYSSPKKAMAIAEYYLEHVVPEYYLTWIVGADTLVSFELALPEDQRTALYNIDGKPIACLTGVLGLHTEDVMWCHDITERYHS